MAAMTPWWLLAGNNSSTVLNLTLGNARALATNWAVTQMGGASQMNFNGTTTWGLLACSRSLVAKTYAAAGVVPQLDLMRFNTSNPLASLFARVGPYYNTGLMVGDIRGCWLSDVMSGAVAPTELVTNGTFNTDLTGWTQQATSGGGIAWSAGSMAVTGGSSGLGGGYQDLTLVPGKTYRISGTTSADSLLIVYPGTGFSGGTIATLAAGGTGAGTVSLIFTASATTQRIMGYANGTKAGTIDDVSVQEVIADRSYKNNPLLVTGSLTKSAANAATQIMLYGGWSAANYARQAYSANLDPATGALRGTIWGTVPQAISGASNPAPGGTGPLLNYINPALFASSAIPPNFTTQWVPGTGWSTPSNTTATSNGSQTGNSDLTWNAGGQPTIGAGNVRMWTINVSAINGTLVVYANNNINFNITAPGTYYGFSNAAIPTAILRATAGTTVSLTLGVQELLPAMAFHRAGAAGASYGLGINALAQLVAFCNDGTTNRVVTAQAPSSTSQAMLIKAAMEYATSGTLSLRINGAPVQSTVGAPLGTLTNAAAVLTVGADYGLTAGWPGGLALLRIGMTNATQEQSALCYEQEYMMFQPGAVCALADASTLQGFDYDASQQKLKVVSSGYENSLVGLTFAAQAAVSAGSFTRCAHQGGMKMLARSTTNPGVDILVPAYALREELANRDRAAAERARLDQPFDFSGGFTAIQANGSTALTNASGWTYPSQANQRGVGASGTNIPVNTVLTDYSGTTAALSAAATGAGAQQISLKGFRLPPGIEATDVYAGPAGSMSPKMEGVSNDYTRAFDGFCETVLMTPGYNAQVRINGRRWQQ
jgi:hypothetical protein